MCVYKILLVERERDHYIIRMKRGREEGSAGEGGRQWEGGSGKQGVRERREEGNILCTHSISCFHKR